MVLGHKPTAHLEGLEKMLASRVHFPLKHDRMRREVGESVVWVVLVIEENSSLREAKWILPMLWSTALDATRILRDGWRAVL